MEEQNEKEVVGKLSSSLDSREDVNDLQNGFNEKEFHDWEKMAQEISILSAKCARLEAQNILIPVQKLDFAARVCAWILSITSFYIYVCLVVVLVDLLRSTLLGYNVEFPLCINWILKAILSVCPYIYNRWNYNVVHRRFEVFTVAFVVIGRTWLARWRERVFLQSEVETKVLSYGESCTEEAIWDANYEISARFLYVSILRLKGLWTKTAQYLSSRADFMPASYVRELKKLQDEAPATNWKDIILPRKVLNALSDVDPIPLASASIGQVHVARIKETGEKVVIKVQHPSAYTLMMDDFWSLKVIARFVAWMDPEYAFFEILMNEWAQEATHELNFVSEAKNLIAAKNGVKNMFQGKDFGLTNVTSSIKQPVPFQVEIPIPLMDLTCRNTLVMTFCEGSRIDDFDQMKQHGISHDAVMDAVTQTFAHMMYISDIFNGDPHPGNIFLRPGTSIDKKGFTLILLDWGLAKRMPQNKRFAFCQMALAAATFDFGMLLDAFDSIGLKMKRENVAEDMEGMRFLLRDVVRGPKSRKRIKSKIKVDRERMSARKKGEKLPMESKAYPGELFFFIRVNELLHGLGSRLSVDMVYLDVIKPYAEKGLKLVSKVKRIKPSPDVEVKDTILTGKLQNAIQELQDLKKIEGIQICVLDKDGHYLANMTSGSLGGIKNDQPMETDTLVLGFSCTKAITATIAHIMVQEGYLDYDEAVCDRVWPSFCPTEKAPPDLASILNVSPSEVQERWNWKRRITLRHILTHKSGFWSVLPHSMTIKSMGNCETCVRAYEFNREDLESTLLPVQAPGGESEYHYLSFGWLVAGTLCGAFRAKHGRDATFEQLYDDILKPKLSVETRSLGFRPCGVMSDDLSISEVVTSDLSLSRLLQLEREKSAMGEGDEVPQVPKEILKSFRGKEFLLDPRIWNCRIALNANVPAAGGRFSAMGLAHFYHDLGFKIFDASMMDSIMTPVATGTSAMQGVTNMSLNDENRVTFCLGYQLIAFDNTRFGVGHSGIGGSIGLYHPDSGLSIGFMTNRADGGHEVTKRISQVIMEHFNL
jgi:aarF domain-containing kinase